MVNKINSLSIGAYYFVCRKIRIDFLIRFGIDYETKDLIFCRFIFRIFNINNYGKAPRVVI